MQPGLLSRDLQRSTPVTSGVGPSGIPSWGGRAAGLIRIAEGLLEDLQYLDKLSRKLNPLPLSPDHKQLEPQSQRLLLTHP